ncbi:zinc-ribbon domain-containing protein [Dehalococcoides mccartyi]|uniref:zinc-ribbon domain-containing protein n=1 Tax=Dehalococcoides mccartyi TaxID=61435 RepID=UPI002AFDFF56|nr:zinc-ribbon domain-containing protein [Dehalococcoides mccartyi]
MSGFDYAFRVIFPYKKLSEKPGLATDNTPSTPGRYCPKCGSGLSADASFCPACGQKVTP